MVQKRYHIGPKGPSLCSVDKSNPRSRGCKYSDGGHYSTFDEANKVYEEREGFSVFATVTKEDLKAPVSPKVSSAVHAHYRRRFSNLVKSGVYGISRDNEGNYVAEDSSSLSKFCRDLGEDACVRNSCPGYDDVTVDVKIPHLGITVSNQNWRNDLSEFKKYSKKRQWFADRIQKSK